MESSYSPMVGLALFVLSLFLTLPARAADAFSFALCAGLNQTRVGATGISDTTYASGNGYVGGFLLGISPAERFHYETGALYFTRKIKAKSIGTAATYAESFGQLEVPVLVRFRIVHHFSLAVGFYGDLGFGDISETSDAGGTSRASFQSKNLQSLDYGWIGSARYSASRRIFVDLQTHQGLANLSGAASTEFKFNSYALLLGVTFGGSK